MALVHLVLGQTVVCTFDSHLFVEEKQFVRRAHSGHWKWDAGVNAHVNAHLNTPEYDQFIANNLGYSRVCICMIIWIIPDLQVNNAPTSI